VRRCCPALKRGRRAGDIGRRISKATVGSFSRRTKDDAAPSTVRGRAEPTTAAEGETFCRVKRQGQETCAERGAETARFAGHHRAAARSGGGGAAGEGAGDGEVFVGSMAAWRNADYGAGFSARDGDSMGFFDRLFGKKPANLAPAPLDGEDFHPSGPQPIHGPPEFVRAVELHKAYWTHNAEEQSQLEASGLEQLNWWKRLRLHHLFCLQRLNSGPERAAADDKCRQTALRLLASDSPYRPRPAIIWQGQSAQPKSKRQPDLQGEFLNPSLTHLGCLEIYRVDAANQPTGIDFVNFDELSGVVFAPSNLIRAAKLFYNDGRDQIVLVPLLYGLTWMIGNEFDRDGRMTRFVSHLDSEELGALGASGMGVGQQDLTIRSQDGRGSLFGLGSVAEISFPLDMRDPLFDEKARARGIDPNEVRRRMDRG